MGSRYQVISRRVFPCLLAVACVISLPAVTRAGGRLSSAPAPVLAQQPAKPPAPDAPTDIIVQLRAAPLVATDDRSAQGLSRAAEAIDNEQSRLRTDAARLHVALKVRRSFRTVLDGQAITVPRREVDTIRGLPYVASVTSDERVQASDATTNAEIGAPGFWSATGVDGSGESIAIVDTGIDYTRPDLGGCFGPGCKVIGGTDFVNGDPDPMDDQGHGTHVAGIAAADGTLKGVAPGAHLLAYKVLDSHGSGSESDVIAGIDAAVDPDGDPTTDDGADVINLSLAADWQPQDAMTAAVDAASAAGVVVAVGAGNRGPARATIGVPADAESAITVGASDNSDVLAAFSSRGPSAGFKAKPDLIAPGVGVLSTVPTGSCALCDPSGYEQLSGTSMATPHVAGAAALLLGAHPGWTPDMVKRALMASAMPIGAPDIFATGAGRLDVGRAAALTMLPEPATITFMQDQLTTGTFSDTQDVTLSSVISGDQAVTCAGSQLPPGVTISCSPVTLPAGGSAGVAVTMNVNNDELPDPPPPDFTWTGRVTFSSAVGTISLPFYFMRRAGLLRLTFDEQPERIFISNRQQIIPDPYEYSDPNQTGILYYPVIPLDVVIPVPSGTYDIVVEFPPRPEPDLKSYSAVLVMREGITLPSDVIHISSTEAVYRLSASVPPFEDFTSPVILPLPEWSFTWHGPGNAVTFTRTRFDGTSDPEGGDSALGVPDTTTTRAPALRVSCISPNWELEMFARVSFERYVHRGWQHGACANDDAIEGDADFASVHVDFSRAVSLPLAHPDTSWRSFGAFGCSGVMCVGGGYENGLPYQNGIDLLMQPDPFEPSYFGAFSWDVNEATVIHPANPAAGDPQIDAPIEELAQSPVVHVTPDGVVQAESPVSGGAPITFNSRIVPIALTPLHWSGHIVRAPSGHMQLLAPLGNYPNGYTLPELLPLGYPRNSGIPFGALGELGGGIATACPSFALQPAIGSLPAPAAGHCPLEGMSSIDLGAWLLPYTFTARIASYVVAGTTGSFSTTASWDGTRTEMPPYLASFRALESGETTDAIGAGAELTADIREDAMSCTLTAAFSYSTDAGATWLSMATTQVDSIFTASFPSPAIVSSDLVSLRLVAAAQCPGGYAPSFDMQLTPALRLLDTDSDGMPDLYESGHPCLALAATDAAEDSDGDAVTNIAEMRAGTDPCNADTDGDGLPDGWELKYQPCTSPLAPNTPSADPDADGLTNVAESQAGTNPCAADTDGDGVSDPAELAMGKDPVTFCPAMRADLNEDAKVNLLDLSMLASTFGEAVPPASLRFDQNADGKINLLDLSRSASVFGQSIAAACP